MKILTVKEGDICATSFNNSDEYFNIFFKNSERIEDDVCMLISYEFAKKLKSVLDTALGK